MTSVVCPPCYAFCCSSCRSRTKGSRAFRTIGARTQDCSLTIGSKTVRVVSGQGPGRSPDPIPLDHHRSLSGRSSESFFPPFTSTFLSLGVRWGRSSSWLHLGSLQKNRETLVLGDWPHTRSMPQCSLHVPHPFCLPSG